MTKSRFDSRQSSNVQRCQYLGLFSILKNCRILFHFAIYLFSVAAATCFANCGPPLVSSDLSFARPFSTPRAERALEFARTWIIDGGTWKDALFPRETKARGKKDDGDGIRLTLNELSLSNGPGNSRKSESRSENCKNIVLVLISMTAINCTHCNEEE